AALLQEIHRVENERLVDDRAERALVDAGAAGDALLVVDMRCAMVFAAHADRLDLAGALARALLVHNRAVRADLCALAAFHALRLVDVRSLVLVERDGAAAADVLTAVREAAAAGFRNDVAADRALVAGDLDDFD